MNIKFNYENRKECILVDENTFNILITKIENGLNNMEYAQSDDNSNDNNTLDREIEMYKIDREIELKDKKAQKLIELLTSGIISIEEYKTLIDL